MELFAGGGEAGRLMAGLDWARTPLGAVGQWPQSLRAAVRIVLSSRYPMLLLWGPQYTQLYNDAYSALIGDQHPAAMGGDVRVTLEAGWAVLEPLITEAMATGVASWVPALQLMLERAGYREEAYFSVSHAPARDDDGRTVGVLTVCSEVTEQVVGERRLRLLRELSVRAGDETAGVERTCVRVADAIAEHPLDVPFAGIYLRDGTTLRRVAATGTGALPAELAGDLGDGWAVPETLGVTGGPWQLPVRTAVAVPLLAADRAQPLGVLLAGVSPSRALDDSYRSFFDLLAQQVAVAVRNALAYEEERRRAEALAELDRVKTAFFTNVSHEFRTPLTLMLGPLAEALADPDEPLGERQRERLDTARRNATRLLTLVNNLMTFSSLEAGRAGTTPRRVDLARLTADLAGVFRSAVERASLRLVVDCPALPRPTAIDPATWETIVTNLLSNALKFTFVGEIRVTLDSDERRVRLRVSDTGIGISADELPQLFDRFHRVQGVQARSHEGSGIGLALVRELSRLLGGDVAVTSAPGTGTVFTVELPWAVITPTGEATGEGVPGATAHALAEEAMGWLTEPAVPAPAKPSDVRILVVDDNADMRAYLSRLLTDQGWQAETVADGQAALDAVRRRPPDLLLTDVMMPRLDGFALVRALRRDEATRALPVVVLSARAGGESGVAGLDAGADDYVVKPFTAADLIARVRANLHPGRGPGRRLTGSATSAVIASGRALEDALYATVEQARALVDGIQAIAELTGGLLFSTPVPPGKQQVTTTEQLHVPIRSRTGDPLGTLTVLLGEPPSAHAAAQLAPVAAMLASLAESRWELDHERQIAITMQQSLLPESLPELPGWDLGGRYQPATGQVGGDWYDVVPLPGGDVLLAIGDVAGHGLGAAVTAAQLRNAVRAYAVEGPAPHRLLARIVAMLDRLNSAYFATVLVARLTPATGRLTWSSAGHLAPARWSAGHDPVWLPSAVGPPLGITGATYPENSVTLDEGDYLLFFTDGLVETRDQPVDAGVARLLARGAGRAALGAPATDLLAAALAAVTPPQPDDIAAIAVRRHPPQRPARTTTTRADIDRTWTYPLVPTASSALRRDLRAALAGAVDDDLLSDLQLAATEAVNNAVEHAQQPTRPQVDVRLQTGPDAIRISVQDYGSWRGRPAPLDRGRGALLMNAYGDVRVTATSTGTLVVIERKL
ncbi:SpoIIE family protein phosphatase [Actinoplanes sp. N902-109]|uniref:SpoIIE family protein phosphatase n=1 Tax=Actinoplanes sp. (strain N902-109) TaxID=649831 RepID=UPI0003295C2A|nr:SpoIIE family protein phosphatase [Actinoplanes sp. N902-109]AGL18915.1 response regulator receiver sensor signal transduction histidine kinase [Actinoplanes sp. N902-109]